MIMENKEIILKVSHLKQYFPIEKNFFGKPTKYLKAVDDVSFTIEKGKTLGIVGESGCGKTTLGRSIIRLYEPTSGEVVFKGINLTSIKKSKFNRIRPQIQMIFQDPYSSLSPRMAVGDIIGEGALVHHQVDKKHYREYVLKIMEECGLPAYYFDRYPHEFSGGQRQRICIARALALNPELIVCDEPVSALDVSIQAQIINLLKDLQKQKQLTYIFISHDLSVVEHISDNIGVMYLGNLIESGVKEDIFANPLHPYTKALLSAIPQPNPDIKINRIKLEGEIPSPSNPPVGCKFHTRCPSCQEICKKEIPPRIDMGNNHFVCCHLYQKKEK
jgi:peptide/nickel transport system ATP-binding protein